jgi:hypothetical protein
MSKRLPAINIRPRESVRARIAAYVPPGFTEHATILAILEIGLRALDQDSSSLLSTLDGLPTRSPTRSASPSIPPSPLAPTSVVSEVSAAPSPSVVIIVEDEPMSPSVPSPSVSPPTVLSVKDADAEALARDFG